MALFNLNKNELTAVENDKEAWFRDTYVVWSHLNSDNFELIAGCDGSKESRDNIKTMLKRDWEISNKKELFEAIERLKGSHPYSVMAWNLCRANQLLAMGCVTTMIDRTTLNKESAIIGNLMQATFTSWKHLIDNYIAGYIEWCNNTFEEEVAIININDRFDAYEFLKDRCYKIDFNLKLN